MSLDYNTSREDLKIKEYGRNVQNLIQYIKTITDEKERNEYAEVIVNMMAQTDPSQKQNPEFIQKLWNHLYYIADFDLDIDHEVQKISTEPMKAKDKLNYPSNRPRNRHYGATVEFMISKAIELEEGEEKEVYIRTIVSYMKSAYKNWSKENVSDETIVSDLERISEGQLTFSSEDKIYSPIPDVNTPGNNNRNKNNNNRNRNNNNRNNNNRINHNNNKRRR